MEGKFPPLPLVCSPPKRTVAGQINYTLLFNVSAGDPISGPPAVVTVCQPQGYSIASMPCFVPRPKFCSGREFS